MKNFTKNIVQPILKFTHKNERKILKIFLLSHIYKMLHDSFLNVKQFHHHSTEYFTMDSRIIQLLIKNILDTEQYTLEGIANYTHFPFDIIYDAACGISNQFSIAFWVRIVDLYLKVKPDVYPVLINRLLKINHKDTNGLSSLLIEV